jgi:hypothetical protein
LEPTEVVREFRRGSSFEGARQHLVPSKQPDAADSPHRRNPNRRREPLFLARRCLDLPHDVHPGDDSSESSEALAIRVALATEVELRLIADTEEEARGRGVRPVPRHGNRSVAVRETGRGRALESDRLAILAFLRGGDARLDDLDLDVVLRLVVRRHRSVELTAVVVAAIDVVEEVLRSNGRPRGVDLELDLPELGHDEDSHRTLRREKTREERQSDHQNLNSFVNFTAKVRLWSRGKPLTSVARPSV